MSVKYSPFYPASDASGIKGTSVPATRNFNYGEWSDIPDGTTLNEGDTVQYLGSSFLIVNTHIKDALTDTPNINLDYIVFASGGESGDSFYTWIAYADNQDGTVNFTVGPPEGRPYIGVATNKLSGVESTNPADYTWNRLLGASGVSVDIKFRRDNATPATPTGDNPSGWFNQPPVGIDTLWMIKGTKTSTGTLIGVWSTPTQISGLIFRGAYVSTETYLPNQTVTFSGGTYIALVTTINNPPSGTSQANAYWDVIAAPGEDGYSGSPPSSFSATIDLTTSTTGANLRTIADANGYTGASDATVTFRVPNGVVLRGLAGAPGGIGLDSGTWPHTSYSINIDLIVQNGGIVDGGGGNGGGGAGGDAIFCRLPMDITVDSGGLVRRGAGGGGNGGNQDTYVKDPETGQFIYDSTTTGGSGGGGFPNGSPGGSTSGGGSGTSGGSGAGNGGNGGGPNTSATAGTDGTSSSGPLFNKIGYAGGPAGANGYGVRKNGHTVNITNNGTIYGATS